MKIKISLQQMKKAAQDTRHKTQDPSVSYLLMTILVFVLPRLFFNLLNSRSKNVFILPVHIFYCSAHILIQDAIRFN